ncbi:MAG: hypothetical protein EA399_16145 [Desulfovibrionales bacterium]|nr:MAG: hypothetical protein EA399_16145 [Desulfovibrionales bacterium]
MPRSSRTGLARRLEPALILTVLVAALGLCLLWLFTATQTWPALQVERLLAMGETPSSAQLTTALEKSRGLDKTLLPGPHLHYPALLIAKLDTLREEDTIPDAPLLGIARASLGQSLAREPVDADAWAQLAYFQYVLDGPSEDVIAALRLSIYIAPTKTDLLGWRLALAARNQAFWTPELTQMIRSQILLAWRDNPRRLVRTALEFELLPLVQLVLAAEPGQLRQLQPLLPRNAAR